MKFSFQFEVEKLVEDYHVGIFKGQKYYARYRKEKELGFKNDLECTKEFFEKFFRSKSDKVVSVVVETDEGETWLWTKPVMRYGQKVGGWEFVKKSKKD